MRKKFLHQLSDPRAADNYYDEVQEIDAEIAYIDEQIKGGLNKGSDIYKNTVFKELRKLSPDLLRSLYLLSFERYEGFDKF
jgi:hypothetical protein